jgi:hypothetical protein
MEMFPGSLMLAAANAKGLALVIGNDPQTVILVTLGSVLLLVGTVLRYKFPSKQENHSTTPYTFWARPSQPTGYMSNAAGAAAHGTSFNFGTTLEHQNHRRPVGYLALQSTPTTERRANLV